MDDIQSKVQVRSGLREESNVGLNFIDKAKKPITSDALPWLASRNMSVQAHYTFTPSFGARPTGFSAFRAVFIRRACMPRAEYA